MTEQEKNEEAHGLWELAVVRLATIAEVQMEVGVAKLAPEALFDAVRVERAAFRHWQRVSNRMTGTKVRK